MKFILIFCAAFTRERFQKGIGFIKNLLCFLFRIPLFQKRCQRFSVPNDYPHLLFKFLNLVSCKCCWQLVSLLGTNSEISVAFKGLNIRICSASKLKFRELSVDWLLLLQELLSRQKLGRKTLELITARNACRWLE